VSAAAPVIAVDGPSGSGKGTVGRLLARRLGFHLLDSGALYRLTALAAIARDTDLDDAEAVAELARNLKVRFEADEPAAAGRVLLDEREVTRELRTERTGDAASRVAALPAVRAALLGRQRAFRRPPGLVADGRDMGTVVFPDAEVKIYLTASPRERALRRHKQLMEQGVSVSLPALVEEIAQRDQRDANRSVAPLRVADDAELLDTTGLDVDAVTWQALEIVRRKLSTG
jgi:cytidylate kinase